MPVISAKLRGRAVCAETCLHGSRAGEKTEMVTSESHLSSSGAKSQGMKQLMAGGGVALIGLVLVPLLSGLFS